MAEHATAEPRLALFSKDGQQWSSGSSLEWSEDDTVTKIVVGDLNQSVTLASAIPEDFADLYENLTHLHLWQIEDLEGLPDLPDGLKCLDIRRCPRLARVPKLPKHLETLVIEECPAAAPPQRRSFPDLTDLSIRGCHGLPQGWLKEVLQHSPRLLKLDASGCPQLKRLDHWPPELLDLRLNDCDHLEMIEAWPQQLRRLELRGAKAIESLHNFPPALDYIDLGGTESLGHLPEDRGRPRTLYLYGSRIAVPPASEHGGKADENVAVRTEQYFADKQLVGEGDVKRCKLLVLGNGEAGKTCLSLAITGREPAEAKKLGTTHGVQFWDWDFRANINTLSEPVHLHVWDFGGQEIYHSTHRLFMDKGAVFVVVWNPQQDDSQPDAVEDDDAYQDQWRPLQYWIDLIHLACPQKPRIAIVCSHHDKPGDDLEQQWKDHVRPEFHDQLRVFYINSLEKQGQLDDLEEWLQDEVGDLIDTQGTAVPTHWEIAQDLVEGWLQQRVKDEQFAAKFNQLTTEEFREHLEQAIDQAIAADERKFAKLSDARQSGEFTLDDDQHHRLRRTLEFLTHSGWLYWDRQLFEGRVIIGQDWALAGLYAILERREDRLAKSDSDPEQSVYQYLVSRDGRFTRSDLGRLAWNEMQLSDEDQQLLLSLMERCGLCFRLHDSEHAWRGTDVYVSFEHLPTAEQLRLPAKFNQPGGQSCERRELDVPLLHKQHWQLFLADAGSHYGQDAQYASDGLYLENREGQRLLIRCRLEEQHLRGKIEIQVAGPEAAERVEAVAGHIQQFLPGQTGEAPSRTPREEAHALGARAEKLRVFITYAWNPDPSKQSAEPIDYEQPVDAIEEFLKDKPVELLRDRRVLKRGHDLRNFMQDGAKQQKVIVVHSEKYWHSPDCIFELKCMYDELLGAEGKSVNTVLIPVEHHDSAIGNGGVRDRFVAYWREFEGEDWPGRLGWTLDELRDFAAWTIRTFSDDVGRRLDLNIRWQDGPDAVLAAIAKQLGIDD